MQPMHSHEALSRALITELNPERTRAPPAPPARSRLAPSARRAARASPPADPPAGRDVIA